MKIVLCLPLLALMQSALGSVPAPGSDFCETVRRLAIKLYLLRVLPPGAEIVESQTPVVLPCGLPWNEDLIIPKTFDLSPDGRQPLKLCMDNDPALPHNLIKGRVLLVPEEIVKLWTKVPLSLNMDGHLLGLEGGIYRQSQKTVAFIFNRKTQHATKLRLVGTTHELRHNSVTHCEPLGDSDTLCHDIKYIYDPNTPWQHQKRQELNKRLRDLQKQLDNLEFWVLDSELWNPDPSPEDYIISVKQNISRLLQEKSELEMKFKETSSIFALLFYRDLGLIERAANLPNIPLSQDCLSNDDLPLPEDMDEETKGLYSQSLKVASIVLVRFLQVIKYFRVVSNQDANVALKNSRIRKIYDFIDSFKELLEEDKEESIKDILLCGASLIDDMNPSNDHTLPQLLGDQDEHIKTIFVSPEAGSNQIYQFDDYFGFDRHKFDASAWDQLLLYEVSNKKIPLTLVLTVDNAKDTIFEIFAFISDSGLLYFFQIIDDYIMISVHGENVEDKTWALNLLHNKEDLPTLMLSYQSNGIAFYRYRSHHNNVKSIVAENI